MGFTWDAIRSNNLRTAALFLAFFALFAVLSTGIGAIFGDARLGLLLGTIFVIGYGTVAYFQASTIALSLNDAEPADTDAYAQLHNIVEELSIAASLSKPDVYIIHDDAPNAFATGIRRDDRAVAVTTGLLNRMNREEISGVIAHELAHLDHNDTRTMLTAGVLVGAITIMSEIILHSVFFSDREGNWAFIILGLITAVLAPLAAQIIRLAVSRKREYAADARAVEITRNPDGLASALNTLKAATKPMKQASQSLNHLYINSQLDETSWYDSLFSTHPPLDERIQRIKSL